ncbi:MAG: imidazole glycerol phosphate synthase subunit HisH [Hyphomonadaceae bacterium]
MRTPAAPIALIDYGAGNLRSAERALIAAGAGDVRVTSDPEIVLRAERIVLPGQGAFKDCMEGLLARPGLREALEEAVCAKARPFLGICVGMQLLAAEGHEHGVTLGLGWIGGICRPLEAGAERLPHMGWNEVRPIAAHPVLDGLTPAAACYFAHSYVLAPADPARIAAWTEHGERFASAVAHDNIVGVQFHPEKSQRAGLALLARFLDWKP